MNEVRNGMQKEEHKYLYFEIIYGGHKLHKCFRSLLIKGKYIGELRNGKKFKFRCEKERFIVFILILRKVCFRFEF